MGITVIILAAGLGRRMQGDKLHLRIDGVSLIDRVLGTVSRLDAVDKIVVTNDERIASKAAALGMVPVKNPDAPMGQSTSIRRGILAAEEDTQGYLFVMGDQPFLSEGTLGRILEAFREAPGAIIVPVYGTDPGSPVLFPSVLRESLLALEGDTGGRQVIRAHPDLVKKVLVPSKGELVDVDTPEDYRRLLDSAQEPKDRDQG